MFGIIKKTFIVLLTNIAHGFVHSKCVSLSNQKYMVHPTLINLHPNDKVKTFTTLHLQLIRQMCWKL